MLPLWVLIVGCQDEPVSPVHVSFQTVQGVLSAQEMALSAFPGLVGVPNVDDDDENGVADRDEAPTPSEDDLASLTLRIGDSPLTLAIDGDLALVRVYQDDKLILGGAGGLGSLSYEAGPRTVELRVELMDYNSRVALTAQELGGDSLRLPITGAPLILNHHLQVATDVWAMAVGTGNAAFINGFEAALGDAFHTVDSRTYQRDVWVQDELEFATLTSPESQLDFVIDSIRNGRGMRGSGLDNFPEDELFGPDVGMGVWGSGRAQSYDYGGNIEASPPVTVDGVYYPFGRIYYGADGAAAPNQEIRDFFDAQQIQRPFTVPTSWLYVGHIDEFQSIIPDPTAPHGFRLVLTDTDLAWSILEQMDPDTPLVRWNLSRGNYQGHGIDTVGELVDDVALRALNEDLQRDHIDPAREIFLRELGITEDEILRIPGLFEEVSGGEVAAIIPGMANLVVVQLEDQPVRVFLADPFMRSTEQDTGNDPLIAYVRSVFPDDIELHFIDDWEWYHMGLGEVHCGSNTMRQPVGDWWISGLHLLETP